MSGYILECKYRWCPNNTNYDTCTLPSCEADDKSLEEYNRWLNEETKKDKPGAARRGSPWGVYLGRLGPSARIGAHRDQCDQWHQRRGHECGGIGRWTNGRRKNGRSQCVASVLESGQSSSRFQPYAAFAI